GELASALDRMPSRQSRLGIGVSALSYLLPSPIFFEKVTSCAGPALCCLSEGVAALPYLLAWRGSFHPHRL
ncbi:MAG: hypothetical protein RML72_08805, partial [Bacteroidia bacterium]|nr:hypothetical protein [Bacteroidia bacterium]